MRKQLIRFLAVMFAVLVIGLIALRMQNASPAPSPYALPRAAVHQIFAGDAVNSGCSGVMIAPMRMLTAAHCVDETVRTAGVDHAPVKVLKKDEEADLALLLVAIDCPCVPLAAAPPQTDELVVSIGFPLNPVVHQQVLTEGRVQGVLPVLVFTAATAPGNSGGGLFSQASGDWKLVGIVTGVAVVPMGFSAALITHLAQATSQQTIHAFLTPRVRRGHRYSAKS